MVSQYLPDPSVRDLFSTATISLPSTQQNSDGDYHKANVSHYYLVLMQYWTVTTSHAHSVESGIHQLKNLPLMQTFYVYLEGNCTVTTWAATTQ